MAYQKGQTASVGKIYGRSISCLKRRGYECNAYSRSGSEIFDQQLKKRGEEILNEVKEKNEFAVVLASRPYQNDTLVNHDLSKMFTKAGIAVLTADSLPEVNQTELSKSRLDIVNNYHARMLSSAILCAQSEHLEYVQLVSFGCGHDAYLSDEITRMMKEISGKTPLILKVDESDNQGPLGIRVRSFLETVKMGREKHQKLEVKELQEPYPVKFTKEHRKEKIALVPNTSHAFCRIMTAALRGQGIRAVALDIGREEAIRLGKKYVHTISVSQHRSSSEKHWRHWKVESMMTKMLRSLWGNMSETVD